MDQREVREDGRKAEPEEGAGTRRARPAQGLLVHRTRLLREVFAGLGESGIGVVCAPDGFGKTALLLECVDEVRNDPSRGVFRLVDAASMDAERIVSELDGMREHLEAPMHPLAVVDGIPELTEVGARSVADRLRALRAEGAEVLVSCKPSSVEFRSAMGDSFKIGPQALKVRPQEYPEWARAYSIASTADVYGLTQGIPALVVSLQTLTDSRPAAETLDSEVAEVYRTALDDMGAGRDPIYRFACLFLLIGSGKVADLEKCGMKVGAEVLSRLAHDYPMFGIDADRRSFKTMEGGASLAGLRADVARRRPSYAVKAARVLVSSGRVDRAVKLSRNLLGQDEELALIERNPVDFALSGNAAFVNEVVSGMSGEKAANVGVGVLLSVYLGALTTGEYRIARSMSAEIRRRAHEISGEVDAGEWDDALAVSEVWDTCNGMSLPNVEDIRLPQSGSGRSRMLRAHRLIWEDLIAGSGEPRSELISELETELPEAECGCGEGVDVPRVLLLCDRMLLDAFHGDADSACRGEAALQDVARRLIERHLAPLAARVRMTAAICRLMAGHPVVDERAFVDAGTIAVRESDLPTQLLCLVGEGWQAMDVAQTVNARFRAQQVLRLSTPEQKLIHAWAELLDRVAFIQNTSRVGICDEAESIDLFRGSCSSAEAWSVALELSAARYDSELSAWFSMHKKSLLEPRFRPMARQAMNAVGEAASSIRRMMPKDYSGFYLMEGAAPESRRGLFDVVSSPENPASVGSVEIDLLGGFRASRNGHTLTDEIWKRKKAGVLAARLVLARGSFVSRRIISEELWPELDYSRSRENLYVTVSSLRHAFGQQANGPRYLLTQGEGLALNSEFVGSDIGRFDALARDVLLRRTGTSDRQIIESCLKIEQLYAGPLYVPDCGSPEFYVRMRRVYLGKFIDCMLRGVQVALDADDVPSASWLIEAAMRQAPLREDVLRFAMRVYGRSGRRREVVELYNSHLHYLKDELGSMPDEETRLAYESIVNEPRRAVML